MGPKKLDTLPKDLAATIFTYVPMSDLVVHQAVSPAVCTQIRRSFGFKRPIRYDGVGNVEKWLDTVAALCPNITSFKLVSLALNAFR